MVKATRFKLEHKLGEIVLTGYVRPPGGTKFSTGRLTFAGTPGRKPTSKPVVSEQMVAAILGRNE